MTDTIKRVAAEEWARYRGGISLSIHERVVVDALIAKLAAAVEQAEAAFAECKARRLRDRDTISPLKEKVAWIEAERDEAQTEALAQKTLAEQAEAKAAEMERMLRLAVEEIAEDRSVWRNADASPPFTMTDEEEVLADLKARAGGES